MNASTDAQATSQPTTLFRQRSAEPAHPPNASHLESGVITSSDVEPAAHAQRQMASQPASSSYHPASNSSAQNTGLSMSLTNAWTSETSNANVWTWSEPYQNYYRVSWDSKGAPIYHWAEIKPTISSPVNPASLVSLPAKDESKAANVSSGTLSNAELLDSSYRLQASRFFRKGRMFSVLSTVGDTAPKTDKESGYGSVVRHQTTTAAQILRLVSVDNKNEVCYACRISTYGKRGTLGEGCQPSQHAIIYYVGRQDPILLEGEMGIKKNPIGVTPMEGDSSLSKMHVASRLNFGDVYQIEHNVKVKDLGKVIDEDMSYLIAYYEQGRKG
ncbi:hypothetical protein BU16DRAFT_93180 [Lophium mytilinum]|uniref:DUF6590 domain-containing protein n=1 Tax=Lophium mytilinum TaxID=390894 RepID=A0A6A6QLN3_9PEZI|nr:hypothetical protein BU16DRAFT_93180 [Lophium mytilinum]